MVTKLNLSCRFDRVVHNDDTALIQNFKTGWKEPEPVKVNAQMKVEALLVAINLQRAGFSPNRFVVQLVTMPFGVLQAEFSRVELRAMYEEITVTLRGLESLDAQLNPSIEACSQCPAILVCNAVKTLSVKLNPIDTNPDALAHNLDKIKILQKHMEAFEAFCVKGLMSDPPTLTITDYAMVPGAEKRDWKDLELAKVRLKSIQQCQKSDDIQYSIEKLKTHTVAAYEKIYADYYGKKKDDIREAFASLMEGCIEVRSNRPSLKRIKNEDRLKELEHDLIGRD
jgi:hypothetical protein